MKQLELGNLSQIVSAATSLVVVVLAIWGVFFSGASQAVVAYLNSELAARNSRIAAMEARERELTDSIKTREADLISIQEITSQLTSQRKRLEDQISRLEVERESLSGQAARLQESLGRSEFEVVREKIVGAIASRVNFVEPLRLYDEASRPTGSKARRVDLWTGYLQQLRDALSKKLPQADQKLGAQVIQQFAAQCSRLSSLRIDIPALRFPAISEVPEADKKSWIRDDWPQYRVVNQRIKEIQERFTAGEEQLENCLKQVTIGTR
jgi:septal ring factor EnvC (AmiA/AmiB activator)